MAAPASLPTSAAPRVYVDPQEITKTRQNYEKITKGVAITVLVVGTLAAAGVAFALRNQSWAVRIAAPLGTLALTGAVSGCFFWLNKNIKHLDDLADKKREDWAQGDTELIYAIKTNQVGLVKNILALGGNPSKPNAAGTPPLVAAVTKGNVEMIQALVDAGGNPNAMDRRGYNALRQAATMSNVFAVTILLKAGAQVNQELIDEVAGVTKEVLSPRIPARTSPVTQAPAGILAMLTNARKGQLPE